MLPKWLAGSARYLFGRLDLDPRGLRSSGADPGTFDTDPDHAFHFDTDPDPTV